MRKMEIFSCGRWLSKIIRRKLRIPRTHSETGIHRKERENLNGESHGDREEFQPEETKDDEGINKDLWVHAQARKEFHLLSSCWTKSSTYVPREESFLISQDIYCWTKLFREKIYDAEGRLEKPKRLRQRKIQLYWYCRVRTNSFRW